MSSILRITVSYCFKTHSMESYLPLSTPKLMCVKPSVIRPMRFSHMKTVLLLSLFVILAVGSGVGLALC